MSTRLFTCNQNSLYFFFFPPLLLFPSVCLHFKCLLTWLSVLPSVCLCVCVFDQPARSKQSDERATHFGYSYSSLKCICTRLLCVCFEWADAAYTQCVLCSLSILVLYVSFIFSSPIRLDSLEGQG